MPEAAIEFDNVTRDFPSVRAVDGLSFEVPAGTIFGFLGPNGAGKTTTIRMMLGLLEPTEGHLRVLGLDPVQAGQSVRSSTGALLENPGLYEHMSAEENLEFYGRAWHMSSSDRQTRIRDLLSHVGLWDRRGEQVGRWSTGMKQKLALARALLHRPRLVLLDEPTSGLDVMAAKSIRDALVVLVAQQKTTIFLTTHNMQEAEVLCSRVAVIRKGRLLAVGRPDELRAGTERSRVEIAGSGFTDDVLQNIRGRMDTESLQLENGRLVALLPQASDVPRLVRLLVEAGIEIEEVLRGKSSLEEVFLSLVAEQP